MVRLPDGQRPKSLAGLEHKGRVGCPQPGCDRPQIWGDPAHHEPRVAPGPAQDMRQQRRSCGFAMAARHADRGAGGDKLRQHIGPGQNRNPQPPGRAHFGIIGRNQRAGHDLCRTLHCLRMTAGQRRDAKDPQGRQARPIGLVAAADLIPCLVQQNRKWLHAGACDAQQMHPGFMRLRQRFQIIHQKSPK